MSDFYDEKLAGEYLGGKHSPIPVRTLQRWRVEGFGPVFHKLGKAVRYSQSDLDKYLEQCLRQSTADKGGNAA